MLNMKEKAEKGWKGLINAIRFSVDVAVEFLLYLNLQQCFFSLPQDLHVFLTDL